MIASDKYNELSSSKHGTLRFFHFNPALDSGLPARRAAAPERATRRALARVDGAQGLGRGS